ncbi:MAG: DNA alkylation repair protein [Candidatus Hodarchaeales archaeon]
MTSTHTKGLLIERTRKFWIDEGILIDENRLIDDIAKIHRFLKNEYDTIPEKERAGKGVVFVAKGAAAGCAQQVNAKYDKKSLELTRIIIEAGEKYKDRLLEHFGVTLLAELAKLSGEMYIGALKHVETWADHPNWEIRETSIYTIVEGLRKYPRETLEVMKNWSLSSNENLRRLSAEGLRPLTKNKWLRDPSKNDPVLAILYNLRADDSVYVRKSVGNNLKDLSRYMPGKILKMASEWINDAGIRVTDDLASKNKKELGKKNYNLVWTLKHALRWLKERNPEYNSEIEQILGKNYVLYFNEKNNRLAKPALK